MPRTSWASARRSRESRVPLGRPRQDRRRGGARSSFKHARPKDLAPSSEPLSAIAIQALKYLGREAVGPETISALRQRLPKLARTHLLRDARFGSDWIYATAKAIAAEATE